MKIKETLKNKKLNKILISFVMAILIWSFILTTENPEIEMTFRGIEVEVEDEQYLQKEGLYLISPENPRVNVQVRGTKNDLNKIRNNIEASISLKGLKIGENKVNVDTSILEQPFRASILKTDPSYILVNIDEVVSQNLKINVETLGELESEFALGNVRALNNYVRVTGPTNQLNQVKEVVAYVDILDKTETFMTTSNLLFLDKNGIELKDLDISSKSIEIEVPIYKLKSVPIKVKTVGSLGENEKLENIKASPNSVIIRGNKDVVDKISSVETEPINITKLVENESYAVKLKLPEGISLHENTPIKLNFDHIKFIDRNIAIPIANIKYKNTPPGFASELINGLEEITINIYGEESLINGLKEEAFSLYVDLANTVEGENTVNISLESIDGVTLKGIEPGNLQVNLVKNGSSELTGETSQDGEKVTNPEGIPPNSNNEVNQVDQNKVNDNNEGDKLKSNQVDENNTEVKDPVTDDKTNKPTETEGDKKNNKENI